MKNGNKKSYGKNEKRRENWNVTQQNHTKKPRPHLRL